MTKSTHNLGLLLTVMRRSAAIHDSISHASDQAASLRKQEFERLVNRLEIAVYDVQQMKKDLLARWRS